MTRKMILLILIVFFIIPIGKYLWIKLNDRNMLYILETIATEHNEPPIPPLTSINAFSSRAEVYQQNTQNSNLIKLLGHPRSLVYFSDPAAYVLYNLDAYELDHGISSVRILPRR